MNKIKNVRPLDNYFLEVTFIDNFKKVVDFKPYIKGGISDKLSDLEYFKKVQIDKFGGIAWDNGFDFCPNFLRSI